MQLSRRRFLTIASAACLGAPLRAASAYQWHGQALGAKAQIILEDPDAEAITARALAEIARLEDIFSLYRPASELSRLNAQGYLRAPSFELLGCLSLARRVHRITEGRFDPSVQPLWAALAARYGAGGGADRSSPADDLAEAASVAIGFDRVQIKASELRLGAGQALTLNGIAQGYIADRVALLMRRAGLRDVVVDTGEIVAMGDAPQAIAGGGWPVEIAGAARGLRLRDRAVASSSPLGTVFDHRAFGGAGTAGHILDPHRAAPAISPVEQVSVSAPSAALADALSTALCLTSSKAQAAALLSEVKEARIESFRLRG